MEFAVESTGLARGTPPESCVLVIFGASGDLAHRKLFPALYSLHRQCLLPKPISILGFAHGAWDDHGFRGEMESAVGQSENVKADVWNEFAKSLAFVPGDFSSSDDYVTLRRRIEHLRSQGNLPDNILFHLATPPVFYAEIAGRLADAGLLDGQHGWRRVAIEKPF